MQEANEFLTDSAGCADDADAVRMRRHMKNEEEIFQRVSQASAGRSRQTTEHCLCVKIGEQKLYHFRHGKLVRDYVISTSLRPPSCIANSLGTPTGLHAIADKIGAGAPPGTVFKSRVPAGYLWRDAPEPERAKNLVSTRILRLRGLDPGLNSGPGCDSYDRFIYIHGTSHPELLGTPATAGCPVLSDADVIELFDLVPEGSLVWMEE